MKDGCFTKECFATAADFKFWQQDQTEGHSLHDDMAREVFSIQWPTYFPAVLCYRWLTLQTGSIRLLWGWVNHEDFKSQPAVVERVQLKSGEWVEKKVPRKPAHKQEELPPIRGVTLE